MNNFKQMEASEKPYEKCFLYGPRELSDQELLAILIRTGTKDLSVLEVADALLHVNPQYDGLVGLMHFDISEFQKVPGIGRTKALQLSVIGEVAGRIWDRSKRTELRNEVYHSAEAVMKYFKENLRYLDHEEIYVMYLDNHLMLMKDLCISTGTANRSLISAREVLSEGLRIRAFCMILVHNHPSGDPHPSPEDIRFTKDLYQAGRLVGIGLVDHVIIGDNRYYSFKEQEVI